MPAADLVHLLGEFVEVPAEVPGGQDDGGGDQAAFDVAGQGAGLDADRLRGLGGGHELGHQMTVRAALSCSNTAVSSDATSPKVVSDLGARGRAAPQVGGVRVR